MGIRGSGGGALPIRTAAWPSLRSSLLALRLPAIMEMRRRTLSENRRLVAILAPDVVGYSRSPARTKIRLACGGRRGARRHLPVRGRLSPGQAEARPLGQRSRHAWAAWQELLASILTIRWNTVARSCLTRTCRFRTHGRRDPQGRNSAMTNEGIRPDQTPKARPILRHRAFSRTSFRSLVVSAKVCER